MPTTKFDLQLFAEDDTTIIGDSGADGGPDGADSGDGTTIIGGANDKDSTDDAGGHDQSKQGGAEDKKTDDKSGAPEDYGDFDVPEGCGFDDEVGSEFKATAKELNLSKEQAQSLLNLQVKMNQKLQVQMADKYNEIIAGFTNETKTELGKDLQSAMKDIGQAKNWLNQNIPEKYRDKVMDYINKDALVANRLEQVLILRAIGKATAQDSFAEGGKGVNNNKSAAELMYPNQKGV